MTVNILWFDNDPQQIKPYLETLREEGYIVEAVATVTEAEEYLNNSNYKLVIQDVMIPTVSLEEEKNFSPEETDYGRKLGLCFFLRNQEKFKESKTQVLVLTQRVDKDVRDEFVKAGLPPEQFCTKYALRDVEVFLKKINSLTSSNHEET